jgi:hypothetical protein
MYRSFLLIFVIKLRVKKLKINNKLTKNIFCSTGHNIFACGPRIMLNAYQNIQVGNNVNQIF